MPCRCDCCDTASQIDEKEWFRRGELHSAVVSTDKEPDGAVKNLRTDLSVGGDKARDVTFISTTARYTEPYKGAGTRLKPQQIQENRQTYD